MAGACENDTVDSNEVRGRLFSLRAFDDAVAGKAARSRQHPGAEHRFLVEQAAVGLEVKDSWRSSDRAHRHPQPVQDNRQGLDAFRIGACRQADENLPAGDENVATIDEAVRAKVNHRIEVFAQSGAGCVAFAESARSTRPEDDGRPGHAQRGILHEDRVGPGFERFEQRDLHSRVGESMAFAGQPMHRDDCELPGMALTDVIRTPDPLRPVFSEYHDWCSITGMFMLRKGDWKLVKYPGYASQLFDLGSDPHEALDLGSSPDHRHVVALMEAELGKIVDAEALNARAFADQARKIDRYGGREAILKAEDLGYTPPPQVEFTQAPGGTRGLT